MNSCAFRWILSCSVRRLPYADQQLVHLWRRQRDSEEWLWCDEIPVGVGYHSYRYLFWQPDRDNLGPNQACTLFGAQGGSNIITGSSYLSVGYGLNVADLWRRDFLVLIGFVIAFQITQIVALEFFPVSRVFRVFLGSWLSPESSNTDLTRRSTFTRKKPRTTRKGTLSSGRRRKAVKKRRTLTRLRPHRLSEMSWLIYHTFSSYR